MKIDKKIIMPSILVLVSSVLVITLAYFGAEIIENGVNPTGVTTGNLDVSLSDSVVNVSNLKPIYAQYVDSMAFRKEFTINNNSSLNTCNKIYLNINNISDTLKSYFFKYKLVYDENEIIGNFKYANSGDRLLVYENLFIESNTFKDASLYIWIEYVDEVDQLNMLGTKLSANIVIEGTDIKELNACNDITIYERILADNQVIKNDNVDLFKDVADETNESGLFRTTDLTKTEDVNGDGLGEEVLYFRGVVENNYLVFANQCWRIVRTNESGESIKLRYGGTPTIISGATICPQTGNVPGITVGTSNIFPYSVSGSSNDVKYVKWVHEVGKSSNAKTKVEAWYAQNIEALGTNVTDLIVDEAFCNDTSVGSTSGDYVYYGGYTRLYTNKNPQYKCPNESDKYSVSKGNISKPVALLTADELVYSGTMDEKMNNKYFLRTGTNHQTMTPRSYTSTGAGFFIVAAGGSLGVASVGNFSALYPVISLSNNSIVAKGGIGVYDNPYIIVVN
ncbi:MAG: hypothetical protein IJB83_01005 [Bacilli bacterium]|nr:hypothetical protein [Bacilli bacterium]